MPTIDDEPLSISHRLARDLQSGKITREQFQEASGYAQERRDYETQKAASAAAKAKEQSENVARRTAIFDSEAPKSVFDLQERRKKAAEAKQNVPTMGVSIDGETQMQSGQFGAKINKPTGVTGVSIDGQTQTQSGQFANQITAKASQKQITDKAKSEYQSAQTLEQGEDETDEQFKDRQLAAYKSAAQIKDKGIEDQYAIATDEAQKTAQSELESGMEAMPTEEELKAEFFGSEQAQVIEKQKSLLEQKFALEEEKMQAMQDAQIKKTQEDMQKQERLMQARVGGFTGAVANSDLAAGISMKGADYIRDMETQGQLQLKDLALQKTQLMTQLDTEQAAALQNYVATRQQQVAESNQAKRTQAWEQYKFESEQSYKEQQQAVALAKDFPEFFDPQVIDGKIQAVAKPQVEMQAANIAKQFGESMALIKDAKSVFGEDSPVGQSIIMNELSKLGYEDLSPSLLFPPDKKTLADQLDLIGKFGNLPPEVLNKLAAGGQIMGMEMDAEEQATLQVLAQGFNEAQASKFAMETRLQTYSDPITGQMMAFDPRTGQTVNLAGGYSVQNNPSISQNVQSQSKLVPNAKVTTTVDSSGMFSFGDGVDRLSDSINPQTGQKYNMGKQCAGYVNDTAGTNMGSDFASKIAFVPKDESSPTGYNMKPVAGGYFVMNTGAHGHAGMIRGVDTDENGSLKGVYITEYNWPVDDNGNRIPAETRNDGYIAVGSKKWNLIKGFGAPGLSDIGQIADMGFKVAPQQYQAPQQAQSTGVPLLDAKMQEYINSGGKTETLKGLNDAQQNLIISKAGDVKAQELEKINVGTDLGIKTMVSQLNIGSEPERTAVEGLIKQYMAEDPSLLTGMDVKKKLIRENGAGLYTDLDKEQLKAAGTEFKAAKERKRVSDEKLGQLNVLLTGKGGGVKDVAAIFTFMKQLDPTSVVRESEFDTIREAQSKLTMLEQNVGGIIGEKELLNEDTRKQILEVAKEIKGIAEKDYQNTIYEQAESMDSRGILIEDIPGMTPSTLRNVKNYMQGAKTMQKTASQLDAVTALASNPQIRKLAQEKGVSEQDILDFYTQGYSDQEIFDTLNSI